MFLRQMPWFSVPEHPLPLCSGAPEACIGTNRLTAPVLFALIQCIWTSRTLFLLLLFSFNHIAQFATLYYERWVPSCLSLPHNDVLVTYLYLIFIQLALWCRLFIYYIIETLHPSSCISLFIPPYSHVKRKNKKGGFSSLINFRISWDNA